MVKIGETVKPYNLDPRFEAAVVTLACSKPRFYGRVGHALESEALASDASKLAVRAAQDIARTNGSGPQSALLVVQRCRRWMVDGKVTLEQVRAVADLFDDAEDRGLPNEDAVIAELAPVLAQRIRDVAVRAAIDSFGKGGDLAKVVELETKATRIGIADTSIGTILGAGSFEEMAALQRIERLPLGIAEVDAEIGGADRGGLAFFLGGPGDGKSMGLSHVSGYALLQGLHVACATLELPRAVQFARVKANLTGLSIDEVLTTRAEEARHRLEQMSHRLGRYVVQSFPAKVATVEDITSWVTLVEQQADRPVDVLVVDYADKLAAPAKRGDRDNDYKAAGYVYETLRLYAENTGKFLWTASQATRQKDKKKKLDLSDSADSMEKVRVADLVITLNVSPDANEMSFFIAKNRTGKGRITIGPLPCDFAYGQIAPVLHTP